MASQVKPLELEAGDVSCGLVLSLFPGAGLLDAGFTQAGFSVVRGPDTLLGQDIQMLTLAGLTPPRFDGIIAGPPCQDFSRARRRPPSGHGLAMLEQLARVVTQAKPLWWLVENVPGVPTLVFSEYTNQRFNLFARDFGLPHLRNRSFQFGSRVGDRITILRGSQSHFKNSLRPTPLASGNSRQNFASLCEMMGLPRTFKLPGLSRGAQFRAVGNGVPLPMGFAVACAIRDRRVTPANGRPCPCNCGRLITGKQQSATPACRKRLQREREKCGPSTRIFRVGP